MAIPSLAIQTFSRLLVVQSSLCRFQACVVSQVNCQSELPVSLPRFGNLLERFATLSQVYLFKHSHTEFRRFQSEFSSQLLVATRFGPRNQSSLV